MIKDPAAHAARTAIAILTRASVGSATELPRSLLDKYFATRSPDEIFKTYFSYCDAKYGSLRILGMPAPVELTNIYTRIRLHQRAPHDSTLSTRYALDFALRHERFVLLGGPGSGKSTFLKFLLLRSLTGTFAYDFIPFFIPLAELEAKGINIRAFCVNTLGDCGVLHSDEMFHEFSKNGTFAFLIDGLDEIRENTLVHIINEIDDLSALYSRSRFIVSCRYAAYKHWLPSFSTAEIEDFSPREIALFIKKWSKELGRDPTQLVQTIFANARLLNMARTPIILSIICISYGSSLEAASNRGELYREAIDVLLNKWDASRNIKRETRYEHLTFKTRERLLQNLATVCFYRGDVYFSFPKAAAIIMTFFSRLEHFGDGRDVDPEHILKEIELHHGLLKQTSGNTWMFPHLTIQEYFVASYIASCGSDIHRALIRNYLTNPAWREVIILTCLLLPNCDEVIVGILEILSNFGVTTRSFLKIRGRITSFDDYGFEDPAELIRMGARKESDDSIRAQASHLAVVHVSNPEVVGWGRDAIKKYREKITETLMEKESVGCLLEIIDGPVAYLETEMQGDFARVFRREHEADEQNGEKIHRIKEGSEGGNITRRPLSHMLAAGGYKAHPSLRALLMPEDGKVDLEVYDFVQQNEEFLRENEEGVEFLCEVVAMAGLRRYTGINFIYLTRENRQLIKERVLRRCRDQLRKLAHVVLVLECMPDEGRDLTALSVEWDKNGRIEQIFDTFLSMLMDIYVGRFETADNSYKLLVAAEVLSELVESEIVVSPRVRGAAIDTLAKLTTNFPGPPGDPVDSMRDPVDSMRATG